MNLEVTDNPGEGRYEMSVDHRLAGIARYRLEEGRITFFHTEVDPEHEGEGLGGRLAGYALDDARARGLEVVPMCPFIAAYIRRHPDEYLDLVVPAMRARVTGSDG